MSEPTHKDDERYDAIVARAKRTKMKPAERIQVELLAMMVESQLAMRANYVTQHEQTMSGLARLTAQVVEALDALKESLDSFDESSAAISPRELIDALIGALSRRD